MDFAPDPVVGAALARLMNDAERHVRELGRFAELQLAAPDSCEDGLGRVCVASTIRSGLLLQAAIATALEVCSAYEVRSPFTLKSVGPPSGKLEIDIAAYRPADRTLFLLEVVRTYENLSHSRRKELARRLAVAARFAPQETYGRGWICDRVVTAIVTREVTRLVSSDGVELIPLNAFHKVFGTSARGTVHAALSRFETGVHARLAELGF